MTAAGLLFVPAQGISARFAHLAGFAVTRCPDCGKWILTLSRPFVRVPAHRVQNVTQATP